MYAHGYGCVHADIGVLAYWRIGVRGVDGVKVVLARTLLEPFSVRRWDTCEVPTTALSEALGTRSE